VNTQALVGGVGLSRVVFVGVINRLYWVLYGHTRFAYGLGVLASDVAATYIVMPPFYQ
jgi:hypothetical protein